MAIKIALAGNPNCGKTTLFNALTGSNQFVGNWPGVTVEKKEGKLKKQYGGNGDDVIIMDLPGIYSLSPYTLEEVVARNYLIGERPDAILNLVDGTNIERNLYLSTQLMELGIPVVMAVNMIDIVNKNGDKINVAKLAEKLGCPVVEISALKLTGIENATKKAIELAQKKSAAVAVHKFAPEVESVIETVEKKLTDVPEEQKRFFAIKLLEKDDKIQAQMKSVPDVSAEIKQLETAMDDDTESIITNERYTYISSIIKECTENEFYWVAFYDEHTVFIYKGAFFHTARGYLVTDGTTPENVAEKSEKLGFDENSMEIAKTISDRLYYVRAGL